MNEMLQCVKQDKYIKTGILYIAFIFVLGSILNYYEDFINSLPWQLFLIKFPIWTLLYIPFLFLCRKSNWGFKNFGIYIDIKTIVVSIIMLAFVYPATIVRPLNYSIIELITEVYARIGEEIFFRGFVFLLIIKIASKQANPKLWAVMLSSLLFTFIHTQPDTMEWYSFLSTTLILFALPRWITNSLLPGIMMHAFANTSSYLATLFAFLIFIALAIMGKLSGEDTINLKIKGFSKKNKISA